VGEVGNIMTIPPLVIRRKGAEIKHDPGYPYCNSVWRGIVTARQGWGCSVLNTRSEDEKRCTRFGGF